MGIENTPRGETAGQEDHEAALKQAQEQKLGLLSQPDSPQKAGMLRALNDIILNLQAQIGKSIEKPAAEVKKGSDDPFSDTVQMYEGRVLKRMEDARDKDRGV